MKRQLIICVLSFSTIFCYSQSTQTTALPIEQNALDYFLKNIRQYNIYFGVYKKFNPDSNIVYIKQKTYSKFSLTPYTFSYKIAQEFFSLKDSLDYHIYLNPDTNTYYLTIKNLTNVKSSDQYKKDNFGKYDLYVGLTSRFYYNDYYFIRLFINVKDDWFANDAYIKLDKFGNPVDIKFQYGEY